MGMSLCLNTGTALYCQAGRKAHKNAPFVLPPPFFSCMDDPPRLSSLLPPAPLRFSLPSTSCFRNPSVGATSIPWLLGVDLLPLWGMLHPQTEWQHPWDAEAPWDGPGQLGFPGWEFGWQGLCWGQQLQGYTVPSVLPPGAPGPRGETGSPGVDGVHGEKGAQGECAVAPRSAFSAKRSESRSPPLADQPIRFDVVLVNEQGHYDPTTGKFTCEVPGLYYFAVHATVYRASLQFDIMKNGHSIASFFQYYGNWPKPTSLSGGALVRLEPEDEVWVQVGVGDYIGFYASVKTDSTFTGFLVYSYWHNSAVFA